MFRFTASSTEQNDDTYVKNNDDEKQQQQKEQQQHRKRDTMTPENFNLNFGKWNKQPPIGDGDCRRSFIPSLRGRELSNGIGATDSNSNKLNWRMMSQMENNNLIDRKRISIQGSAMNNSNNNEESDDTDNNSNRMSHPPHLKFKASPRTTDSLHSKISSHSFNVTEDHLMNDSIHSYFGSQHKKSSTLLDDDVINDTLNCDGNNTTAVLKNSSYYMSGGNATETISSSSSSMNFIMLLGLIVGLVISKALQYLQLYFKWFQAQVKQLRIAFIGTGSVLEFFNFDDTSRYGVRTKLLLMPLVGAFSILYGVIAFLHFLIRFFLTQAPGGLVSFIQKLYTEV